MMITARWDDAVAIANGYAVLKARKHQVRKSPDGLAWTVCEAPA